MVPTILVISLQSVFLIAQCHLDTHIDTCNQQIVFNCQTTVHYSTVSSSLHLNLSQGTPTSLNQLCYLIQSQNNLTLQTLHTSSIFILRGYLLSWNHFDILDSNFAQNFSDLNLNPFLLQWFWITLERIGEPQKNTVICKRWC